MTRRKQLGSNRLIMIAYLLALIMNGFLWWYVLTNVQRTDETINIHYNIYLGPDLLGPWWYFLLLPAGALAVILVNSVLSVVVYRRQPIALVLLTIASLVVQLLTVLACVLLITQLIL